MTKRGDAGILNALKLAARKGSLSAAFILGRLYAEGWGVTENAQTAFRWYLQAADGGLPEAFYFVGSAYHFGEGVTRDRRRAFSWFQRAAAAGDADGAYMEALSVLEGQGTRQNARRGMQLLLMAARHGSHDAMDYLAAHYLSMGRKREARMWARRAIKAGDSVAPLRLVSMNEERDSAI